MSKIIKRTIVIMIAITMLVTGSGIGVFAESVNDGTAADQTVETTAAADEDAASVQIDDPAAETPAEVTVPADQKEDDQPATAVETEEKSEDAKKGTALKEQELTAEIIAAPGRGGKLKKLVNGDAEIVLSGLMPEGAEVKAYPVDVEVPGQNVLTAYDITIYVKGKEWQPKEPLSVSIKDKKTEKAAAQEYNVYHMEDEDAEPEQIGSTEVRSGAVEFDAGSFSIYIITDSQTRTYIFMNGDDVYNKQVLENGHELIRPTDPVKAGSVFSYWSTEPDGESFNDFGAVEVTDETDNSDVTLYAVYDAKQLHVTYYDQEKAVVETQLVSEGASVDTSAVSYTPIQNQDGVHLQFVYWTTNRDGEGENAGTMTISEDTDLYPVVQAGHWIYFDVNKKAVDNASTTYAAPVFVAPGETPGTTTAVNVTSCDGWNFDGWYTKRNGGAKVFDSEGNVVSAGYAKITKDGELYSEPTLYAHWTPGDVEYSVVYYVQKASDEPGASTKNYEFLKTAAETRTAHAGDTVTADEQKDSVDTIFTTQQDRWGFYLNETKSRTTITSDGSAVLKIYYDRNTYSLVFKNYQYSNKPNASSNKVSTSTLNSYSTAKTITALYGHDISGEFPVVSTDGGSKNYISWCDADQASADSSGIKGEFKVLYGMPALKPSSEGVDYLIHNNSTKNWTTYYYREVVPGTHTEVTSTQKGADYILYKGVVFERIFTMEHGFEHLSESYHFQDNMYGFEPKYADPTSIFTTNQPKNTKSCLYYTRKTHKIHLIDPIGTEGNKEIEVKYGAPVTKALLDAQRFEFDPEENILTIDEDNYWYQSESLAAESAVDYDGFTMPDYDITLYAGVKKQYIVQINPAGGEFSSSNTFSTWFKADPGELVAEYANVPRDYVAARPDEATHRYVKNEYDPEDKTKPRTAYYELAGEGDAEYKYEKGAYILTGWVEEKADGTEEPYNFTVPVSRNIKLKAKWRRNASFRIVYDAGSVKAPADSNHYEEHAHAVAMGPQDTPTGSRFLYWEDKEGHQYRPNQTIEVSEDIAETESTGHMVINLTAVYEDTGSNTSQEADYTFMVGDDVWYVETISSGEELVMPETPESEEGDFTGWYTNSNCTKRFNGFGVIRSPVYTTLYAGFGTSHTVTYYNTHNGEKGDSIITTQEYRTGDRLNTAGVLYETDKEHYVYEWTDAEGNRYPYNKSVTDKTVNGDLELWPVVRTQSLLHFETNGGTNISPIVIPADGRPAAPKEPEKDGFLFADWYTSPDFAEGTLYDFSTALPEGTDTLYAKWDADPKNPAKGRITVLFWAQTADRPVDEQEAAADKEHYELANSVTFDDQLYGSYSLSRITSMLSDEGVTVSDPLCLADVRSRYSTATNDQFKKYFKYNSTKSDASVTVDAADGNVINLYYDRQEYHIVFNIGTSGTINYNGTSYNRSGYDRTVWLDKPMADEWPIVSADRQNSETKDKAWINWTGSNNFSTWSTPSGSGVTGMTTLQLVADAEMINYALTQSNGTLTLTATATESNQSYPATVYYYFNGKENEAYTQDLYVYGTSANYGTQDGKTYYKGLVPKTIEGYDNINSSNKTSSDTDFNPVVDGKPRAVREGNASTSSTMKLYFYYRNNSYGLKLMETNSSQYGNKRTLSYGQDIYEYIEENVSEPPAPRAGVEFSGWSTTPATFIAYTAKSGKMPAYDVTLYATWREIEYTVRTRGVDRNGMYFENEGEDGEYTGTYGTELGSLITAEPSREGYTFAGWKTVGGSWIPMSTTLTGDIEIEPVWKEKTSKQVTYDKNGGTGTAPVDSSRYTVGAGVVIMNGKALTKTLKDIDNKDYPATFVCWNTEADGTGTVYYPGDIMKIADDTTLYAMYSSKREADLIYNRNGEGSEFVAAEEGVTLETEDKEAGTIRVVFRDHRDLSLSSIFGSPNSDITIGRDANNNSFFVRRPGYKFDNWSTSATDEDGTFKQGQTAHVNTLGDGNTLFAVWDEDTLPVEVYQYTDEDLDTAALIEDSAGAYHQITVDENVKSVGDVENAYKLQNDGYSPEDGYKFRTAMVGDDEIDGLRYALKQDGTGYEWQYHKVGAASGNLKPFGDKTLKIYYHKYTMVDLTVTNTISGEYADMDMKFSFTLDKDGEGENETFELGNGESVTLSVPKIKVLTLTEENGDGYDTAFEKSGDIDFVSGAGTGAQKLTMTGSAGTVNVSNTYSSTIVPSGIETSSGFLGLLICVLVFAEWVVLTIRRRRRMAR